MVVKLLIRDKPILSSYYKIKSGRFSGISISLARPYHCWEFVIDSKAETYPVGGNCITLWTDQ